MTVIDALTKPSVMNVTTISTGGLIKPCVNNTLIVELILMKTGLILLNKSAYNALML